MKKSAYRVIQRNFITPAYRDYLIAEKRLILPEGLDLDELCRPQGVRFYFQGLDLYRPQEPFVTILPERLKGQTSLPDGRTFGSDVPLRPQIY
ncbi:hypothetical protein FW774_17165 [Pedobacter sp. BS3]|uniref:hypothetical protein n=1 Tax=Pedobacter sp. BS3 TaxID=2567937 RepID=UPI0011EFD76D|nr:hypothetical protein [Pedobacter sp. BS3]TZF81786.1 hypothetical protein FW774_17165 [Pedobacter sp. BS3]